MQRIVDSDFKAGFVCKAGYFVSVDSKYQFDYWDYHFYCFLAFI